MKVPRSRVMLLNFFLLTLFVSVAHADYRDDEWNHNAVFTTQKQVGTIVSGFTALFVCGLRLLLGSDSSDSKQKPSHEVSSGQDHEAPVEQQYCTLYEPDPAEVERARLKKLAHKKKQKLDREKREAQERILAIEQEKEAAEHRKRASAIDCVAQLYAESEFCVIDPLDDPKLTLFGGLSSDSEWQNEWRERRSKFAQLCQSNDADAAFLRSREFHSSTRKFARDHGFELNKLEKFYGTAGQHLSVDEISEIVGATQLYSVVHGAHEGVEQMCEATMQLVETSYWHTILGKVSKSLELNVICASLVEFGSACAATYQKVAKAADWLDKGVAATVSSAGNAFDYASKLPPEQLRYLTRPAAGFAKGAGGSVSGLFHVVCHPLETVKDLAQMAGNIAYFMVDYFPLPRVAEFALTGRIDEVKELWRAHRAKYGPKEAALKQLVIAEWAKPMPEKLHDIALVAGHLMTDYYMIGRFCQVIKTVRRGKPWVCRTNLGHPEAAKDVCDLFCNNAGVFFEEETSVMRGVSFTHEGKTVTRGCTGKGYRKLSMHEALEDMGHKVKGSGKKGCPIAQSIQRGGASPEQSARLAKYASSYESKWADTIWAKRRGFNGKPFKKLYKIAADNGLLIQRQNSLIMPVGESFRRLVINFNDQIRCPVVLQKQGASRFRVNSQSLFKVEASELKKNSIHGGHIDPGGLYRRIGLLDYEVEHIDLVSGMTRALVKTTNGVTQTKLMFPTSWSGEVILDQIAQGCCNIDKTIACGDGSFNIECSTNAGLRMQMHVDQSGTIRTCTPLESTATYWATPEAFKVFRSSLQHNATNLAPTPAEKMALQILRKRFSGDELARFTLEDHLGEAGVVARLNSQLRLYDTGCGIVPINKCVEYDEYFVILFEKFYAKQSILLHSQAGIAGLYEGLEVEVNVAHVFNHKYKRKKISGGHWDRNSGLKKSGILEVEDIKKGIDGCYKGNAKLLNRSFYDGKSYFGDDWTAEQIAQALCEALENITSVELEKGALHKMYGRTKMGLEIEMMARYKNGKIYVNSFYPKIN